MASTIQPHDATLALMAGAGWIQVSLARKISVLFGTAVLLTIVATLAFPWLQMTFLIEQTTLLSAKQTALAAYSAVDLRNPDWTQAQEFLQRRWPLVKRESDLPSAPPRFIPVDGEHIVSGLANREDRVFCRRAIEHLTLHPDQQFYSRADDSGRVLRLAMAVRGADTDDYPGALRGIVAVRQSVARHPGIWNSVVTLLAGASGAVLAILVFYMVTQRLVLSPVHALRRVAEQVTSGDIEVRAKIRRGDEFGKLSEAFNDMLTHLKAAQDDLRKVNRSMDIRLEDLAEANVALYESDRVKSGFLANVSHELRTPLVSIIGFAELLRDAWDNPDTDRKRLARYTDNILTSGRSLLEIINDLLDLAKIDAGKLELHILEFSITDLCGDLIDFVRPLADKANQQLVLWAQADLPRCTSDSGKIKQILYNLLSNAIKFTPTGGTIRMSVARRGDSNVALTVSDTGPGIEEEQQVAIFDKFQQLDSSRTREHEGTGLGLAITKELTHRLGGTICVDSAPGEGATFTVVLPIVIDERS